jgi:hypothetical protein
LRVCFKYMSTDRSKNKYQFHHVTSFSSANTPGGAKKE